MISRTILSVGVLLLSTQVCFAAPNNTPMVIGVSVPLTGELSEYGVAAQHGVETAISERPADFAGIKFVFEDHHYDAKTAVAVFQKLKDVDNSNLQFVWGDGPSSAVVPLAKHRAVPVIAMTTDPLVAKGNEYVFRFINAYDKYSDVMLRYLRSKGMKHIGVIHVDDPYYVNLIDGIKIHLKADESITVSDKVTLDDHDFKTPISKLKAASFDAVAVYLWPGQVSQFYRQASAMHLTTPTFGADVFESQSEIADANGGMDGAVYAHNLVSDSFRAKYVSTYHNDYQIAYAANSYEFANVMADCLKGLTATASAKEVIQALAKFSNRDGAAGKIQLKRTKEGDYFFDFPVAVKGIKGKRIEVLMKMDA